MRKRSKIVLMRSSCWETMNVSSSRYRVSLSDGMAAPRRCRYENGRSADCADGPPHYIRGSGMAILGINSTSFCSAGPRALYFPALGNLRPVGASPAHLATYREMNKSGSHQRRKAEDF